MKLDFLNNRQFEVEEGAGAVSLHNIATKKSIHRNFVSPYTVQEEEKITDILKAISAIPYAKPEKAFHTMEPNNIEDISAYLEVLVPLFDEANYCKNEIKKQLLSYIERAKIGTIEAGGEPISNIHFVYTGNTDIDGLRDTKFGETLEQEYNVALYEDSTDEGNHGGSCDIVSLPGYTTFGGVRASEDLIKQRPNVILIVITAQLRPKWRTMAHYMFHPHAPKLVDEALDNIWRLTDEQVKEKYWTVDDGEY